MASQVPPGWTQQGLDSMALAGKGASARYGQRPPSPDSVAARGTPEWRQAFNAQRDWMQKQIFGGASLMDLGFAPEKEHGLHAYTALREGDFSPFNSSWAQAARGSERGTYNPVTGAYTMSSAAQPWYGPGGDKTLSPFYKAPAPAAAGPASTLTPDANQAPVPLPAVRRRSLLDLG